MNQVTEEQKSAVTKSFAIIGFVAAILFAVWLAVQVVSVIPSAFSSLASLADGVYNYREQSELVVANANSVVNVGEVTAINWSEAEIEGYFTFSYKCTDGVAVNLHIGGEKVALDCNEAFDLEQTHTIEISVESEKERFVDLAYTVTFNPEVGQTIATDSKVTVVNQNISTSSETEEDTVAETEETAEEEIVEEPAPEVAGENTTTNEGGLTAGTPTTIEEIIYAIPTSDPNGTTDLAIKYLGVGILDTNNRFIQAGSIQKDQTGAFQFEVRNIGTKTSEEWSYQAKLPAQIDYNSSEQAPLKPNEKAVITIGFEGISQTGNEIFSVSIDTDEDTNASNNSFTWAITIVE